MDDAFLARILMAYDFSKESSAHKKRLKLALASYRRELSEAELKDISAGFAPPVLKSGMDMQDERKDH